MNCISFPKIFNGNSTVIKYDNDATLICMHTLLSTEIGEMFGDPDFGVRLKKYYFEQNNYILRDILIDDIYTCISTFIKQVMIDRGNITITQDDNKLYANIVVRNKKDFTLSTYNIELFNNEEEQ